MDSERIKELLYLMGSYDQRDATHRQIVKGWMDTAAENKMGEEIAEHLIKARKMSVDNIKSAHERDDWKAALFFSYVLIGIDRLNTLMVEMSLDEEQGEQDGLATG